MKNRLFIILLLFLVSPCIYSQHIANVIEVKIPLNSTKESAVKKLLNKGYELFDSYDEDDYSVLKYKRSYYEYVNNYGYYEISNRVWLYIKYGKVSMITWDLHYGDQDAILKELKYVYNLKPYKEIDDNAYYNWEGSTMIVNGTKLILLPNNNKKK